MSYEALSVDAAKKAEHDAEVAKRRHTREIAEEARGGAAGAKSAAVTPSMIAKVQDAIASKRGRKRKDDASASAQSQQPEASVEDPRVRQAELLAKYTRYANHRHPAIRAAVGGIAPNPRWSVEELQLHLDRVRQSLNSAGAEMMIKRGLITAAHAAEWLTMRAGINPTAEDLHDFGVAVEELLMDNEEVMQPELGELQAEVGSLLIMPWYARLAMKMAHVARAYSMERKASSSSSSRQKRPRSAPEMPPPAAVQPAPEPAAGVGL